MKNIFLVGDSIRKGYDKFVSQNLKDYANVYFTEDNCRFTLYTLRYLSEWKDTYSIPDDVDIVHWNTGLWDCLTQFDDGPLTPPEFYYDTIKRIDKRIRILFPKAKVIFATSTRVLEEEFRYPFVRYNKDIMQYNEIAKKALEGTGTIINDLWALTENCPVSYYSDMTHLYTPEGTELIGNAVLDVLCRELSLPKIVGDGHKDYSDVLPVGI